MKAAVIYEFGGPDKIQIAEMPKPVFAPDGVLIRTVAAGVNPVDWKTREGRQVTRLPHHFPLILGWDVAGVVEEVGNAVTNFRPGDRVVAYARKSCVEWGTYAQYVAVAEDAVAPAPNTVDLIHGAVLPLAALTAYQLIDVLGLGVGGRGRRVLVLGASGGVGSFLVPLLVERGVEVIGSGSPSGHDFMRRLGAAPIDRHGDVAAQVNELAPEGVDAIADLAGPDVVRQSLQVLKDGGTVGSILLPPPVGDEEQRRGIKGRYVFVRPYGHQLKQLVDKVDAGVLSIHLDRTFPLDDAAEAHRALQDGGIRGKIALTVQ